MKKIFAIAAMAVACLSANAQQAAGTWSVTPKVGIAATNQFISGDGDSYNGDAKIGLVAGAEVTYQASNRWGISAGALYTMEGAKWGDENYKENFEYINVPILANFYPCHGLAIKAGVQPGFLTKAKYSYDSVVGKGDVDIKDNCNSVDFSIPVGVSYEFDAGIMLDARYNIGISNIYKNTGDVKTRNLVFQFTVGYKFGL